MAEISPSEPSFDLAGRTIIVTGGGKGIGKPSRRGNRVCLADPAGRVFKAVGRRLGPRSVRAASRRGPIRRIPRPCGVRLTGLCWYSDRG